MKKIFVNILLTIIILNFAGCSNDSDKNKEYDLNSIAEEILMNVDFEDELSKIDNSVIPGIYNVNSDDLEDSVVYVSSMATAEEIALFKFKDSKTANENFIKERIEYQKNTYKDYNSKELIKLDKPYIKVINNYVFCVVANDITKCNEIIK